MFMVVLAAEIALQLIIMLCPGISTVFSVFHCYKTSDRCYLDDKETSYTGPINQIGW